MPANLCVARLAKPAGAVAHTSDDDDQIALGQCSRFRHEAAYLFDSAGDLMTGRDRKRQRMIGLEIAVHHLRVGPAHAGRRDFQQDLIGCYFGNFDIFENKRLSVTMHSRCAHWHSLPG